MTIFVDIISKIELAALRRLPVEVKRAYVPSLKRSIFWPARASSAFHEIYINKIYEPIRPLQNGSTIVDLGANLGIFAIYASNLISDGNLILFEASPAVAPYLTKNISTISNVKIKLFNVAVANYDGDISFFVDSSNATSLEATAFRDITKYDNPGNFRKLTVPCKKIDSCYDGYIDFLKCDIEGAEYSALGPDFFDPERVAQGAVEFHGVNDNWEQFSAMISGAERKGFALFDKSRAQITFRQLASARNESIEQLIVRFCDRKLMPLN